MNESLKNVAINSQAESIAAGDSIFNIAEYLKKGNSYELEIVLALLRVSIHDSQRKDVLILHIRDPSGATQRATVIGGRQTIQLTEIDNKCQVFNAYNTIYFLQKFMPEIKLIIVEYAGRNKVRTSRAGGHYVLYYISKGMVGFNNSMGEPIHADKLKLYQEKGFVVIDYRTKIQFNDIGC